LSTDELGNQLCKSLGRKEYRQQIKLVKSLESFLRSDCLSTNEESSLTLHFDPNLSKIYLLRTLKDDKETSLTKEDLKINDKTSPVLAEKLSSGETIDDVAETSKMESSDKELIYRLSKEDAQLLLPCPEIVFETGDIFEVVWWTEADVAYAASLLFSDAMMLRLTEKVLLMKAGAWFITLKPLVSFSPALLKYCEAVFANAFHFIPLQLRPEHRYYLRRSSRIWLDYAAKAFFECPGKWPRCSSTSDASPSLWPKYDIAQLHILAKKQFFIHTHVYNSILCHYFSFQNF